MNPRRERLRGRMQLYKGPPLTHATRGEPASPTSCLLGFVLSWVSPVGGEQFTGGSMSTWSSVLTGSGREESSVFLCSSSQRLRGSSGGHSLSPALSLRFSQEGLSSVDRS